MRVEQTIPILMVSDVVRAGFIKEIRVIQGRIDSRAELVYSA
jgi:hypothetical protein